MTLDISKIKGVIWDLDNTLYRFTDDFKAHCNKAAAAAAIEMGIDMSHADAIKIAERSEELHGYSMHIYVTDHGLSYADLHIPFHSRIDEKCVEPIMGALEVLEFFKDNQIVLTNASRCWAERAIHYIGAKKYFDDDFIVPIEDVDFVPKAQGDDGFKRALEILNLEPHEVLMVDDLDRNLKIAHDLGMQTAYMHHGKPMIEMPDYVSDQYENLVTMVNSFEDDLRKVS